MGRHRTALLLAVGLLVTAAACSPAPVWPVDLPEAPSSAPPPPCPPPWGCAQADRFDTAAAQVAATPGELGIVVRRRNGAQWQAGVSGRPLWAGSTPKLAMAVDLLERSRSGEIRLDQADRDRIDAMLSVSDNDAADALWNRYVDADQFMTRLRGRYGMTTATYVDGFPDRWGFIKCSALDLANLAAYVLDTLNPTDRAYVVAAMRAVGEVQQWGVWGAGRELQPGVKNGWSIERDDGTDHWITATVGFVGPDEGTIVAAMYHQPAGDDSLDRGVHVLTDLVAMVFGARVPAPAVVPPPD